MSQRRRRWRRSGRKGVRRGTALQLSSAARLTRRPCCTIRCVRGSVSILDTRSGLAADSSGTIAYVLYAIVFRETSGRHTRTLSDALSFLLGPRRGDRLLLCLQGTLPESLCTWLVFHLVRSSRFEPAPNRDIVYPLLLSSRSFFRPRFAFAVPYPSLFVPLRRSRCSFCFIEGMKRKTRTGVLRPSLSAIVRPLSTQPWQIRF